MDRIYTVRSLKWNWQRCMVRCMVKASRNKLEASKTSGYHWSHTEYTQKKKNCIYSRYTKRYLHISACKLSCFSHVHSLPPYGNQSPPGSSVQGILRAKIQEWMAMPSSSVLPNPGIEPLTSYVSCTGSEVLYNQHQVALEVKYCQYCL